MNKLNVCPKCGKSARADIAINVDEGTMAGVFSCSCGWEVSFQNKLDAKSLEAVRKERKEGIMEISMVPMEE